MSNSARLRIKCVRRRSRSRVARMAAGDVGLREHAATQQHSDFLGVDLIVFRALPPWMAFIESVAKDKRNALRAQRSRASTR